MEKVSRFFYLELTGGAVLILSSKAHAVEKAGSKAI